jgi:hypothetical protein
MTFRFGICRHATDAAAVENVDLKKPGAQSADRARSQAFHLGLLRGHLARTDRRNASGGCGTQQVLRSSAETLPEGVMSLPSLGSR